MHFLIAYKQTFFFFLQCNIKYMDVVLKWFLRLLFDSYSCPAANSTRSICVEGLK